MHHLWWGKIWGVFNLVIFTNGSHRSSHPWTMHMFYIYVPQLVYPLPFNHYHILEFLDSTYCSLFQSPMVSVLVITESMLPSQVICHVILFKGSSPVLAIFIPSTHLSWPSLIQLCYMFYSIYLCMFRVDWWGIHHGPPSIDFILSTPSHYPGLKSRNQFSTLGFANITSVADSLSFW